MHNTRWAIYRNGVGDGPYSTAQVQSWVSQGEMAGAYVRDYDVGGEWIPIDRSPFAYLLPRQWGSKSVLTFVGVSIGVSLACGWLFLGCSDPLPYKMEFCPPQWGECRVMGAFPDRDACEDYQIRFSSRCCSRADSACLLEPPKPVGYMLCEMPTPLGPHNAATYRATQCRKR